MNDGPLNEEQVELLPSLSSDAPIATIQQYLHDHGYVLVKGSLPRADVLQAREKNFKLLSSTEVLKPGTAPVEGIFDHSKDSLDYPGLGAGKAKPAPNPQVAAARFVDLAIGAHHEAWYKDVFCKHPALLDYVAKLTGWGNDTLGIQRTLLRNNTPGNNAIGVHYDQIFLRDDEDTALTAWVPMGDVTLDGGGLIYLEDGHTLGNEIENDFTLKAKQAGMTDAEAKDAFNQNMMTGGMLTQDVAEFGRIHGRKWLATAYEAGDVVFHNSYAVSTRVYVVCDSCDFLQSRIIVFNALKWLCSIDPCFYHQ